jgi:hypothetical protein
MIFPTKDPTTHPGFSIMHYLEIKMNVEDF